MHNVQARPMVAADAEVGAAVLYHHGSGYIEAKVVSVRTKERRERAANPSTGEPGRPAGIETHFGVSTSTGLSTGSAFYPEEPTIQAVAERFLVTDTEGEVTAEVLDYIGCANNSFMVPGVFDPEAAAKIATEALEAAGIVVGHLSLRPVTEQRVIVSRTGVTPSKDQPVGECYEHETGKFGLGAHHVTYLPVAV